jgi:hypothetical protein
MRIRCNCNFITIGDIDVDYIYSDIFCLEKIFINSLLVSIDEIFEDGISIEAKLINPKL